MNESSNLDNDTIKSPIVSSSSSLLLSSSSTTSLLNNKTSPNSVVNNDIINDDDNNENDFLVTKASKKEAMKVIIGDESVSLQASFEKFRVQKKKERQILQMCRGDINGGPRSEVFKESLRQKVIIILL